MAAGGTTSSQILTFLVVGGGAAAIVNTIRILIERRKIGADATEVVTRAARELVDPLRQELENERRSNAEEIALERRKVAQLRKELDQAMLEVRALRAELQFARHEADQLRNEADAHRRRIRTLEAQAQGDLDGTR
jgi:chromosome segregation ATPase